MIDDEVFEIPYTRGEKLLIGVFLLAFVAGTLALVYAVLRLKADAFNARTGADVSPWEILWLDTTYTGPK
jgi:hypothetical protein